jgi:hypothetical protein
VLAEKVYQSLWHGWSEVTRCVKVDRSDEYWIHEMPWMTLYFTFAVWSSIWMAQAKISGGEGANQAAASKKKK